MSKRMIVLSWLALVACGGGGGGDDYANPTAPNPPRPPSDPAPTSALVSMETTSDGYGGTYNGFTPTTVRVARGGRVTWRNGSSTMHNVSFGSVAGAPADIANFEGGENVRTFDTAGTFAYRCTNHQGMSGSVTVQ